MIYKVVTTPEAQEGLRDAYRFIRQGSPEAAKRWARGVRKAIRELSRSPARCSIAPESVAFDGIIRELFYGAGNRGTYRILFTVIDKTVFVLHVRHGAMQPLLSDD
jgi:plasmid stabilization system protein ParE